MRVEQIGNATLYNCDCMKLMATMPDKSIDLAIVDPPYGINMAGGKMCRGGIARRKSYKLYAGKDKDAPPVDFFKELFRVSKNQIIFGANHFIARMPYSSPCWIVWDKQNGKNSFADCELAWTSFKTSVRKFAFRWCGMLQGNMKNKERRIHPNQKPVALYEWLLNNYAKQGDKILDTHFGSGSIAIACNELGFELTASDIDKYYFNAACKRIKEAIKQNEKT